MNVGGERWLVAGCLVLAYACLCSWVARRRWRLRAIERCEATQLATSGGMGPAWLLLYASQTGNAEHIARDTARRLHAGGLAVRLAALDAVPVTQWPRPAHVLLVLSTYGEGDPPDNAVRFLDALDAAGPDLRDLRYGVLALGDRQYRHFCGFGRTVDLALAERGAHPLFPRIDVDQGDDQAIHAWYAALGLEAGGIKPFGDATRNWQAWTLQSRHLLNAGSAGAQVWLVRLAPPPGVCPVWESGDLAQLRIAVDAAPREYSIASISGDGLVELVVRRILRSGGRPGLASQWLCADAMPGEALALRLRAHHRFRLGGNVGRPLLLVGNGTGIAGLRGHLRASSSAGRGGHWLVFGERNAAHDVLFAEEIAAWQAAGVLARVDRVFSRDGARLVYVQHVLQQQALAVSRWVDGGGAIYVCGSRHGMAAGVDAVLRTALGEARFHALIDAGRYRRDVY